MLARGVQLSVHDEVFLDVACNLTVARRYTFTNMTGDTINFNWNGRDHLPAATCNVSIQPPGIAIGTTGGATPVLEWDLPSTSLQPEGVLPVCITFMCPNLAQLNPLRFALCYQSTWICGYSFAVRSPFGGLIQADDCTVICGPTGDRPSVILGHDGVLRPDHPARVSAGTGACSLIINKTVVPSSRIPLLQYYAGRSHDSKPLSGQVALLIPHLLRDSVPYIESLVAAGLQPDRTFIIGIPYSAKRDVASALWQRGFRNIELPTDYPFTDTVRQVLGHAIQLCQRLGQPLLVVEDGGYAGPLLHTDFASDLFRCSGIVEQTRNGIWQYKEQNIEPKVPILNVAESQLKLRRESPLVGRAVVFNVQALIHHFGKELTRYRAIVVGYGDTGSQVATALHQAGVNPTVFDQQADRRQKAMADGYTSGDSLAALLEDRDLIIGCTGQIPFQFSEIIAIKHQTIFVNASSKRREINYHELDPLTDPNVPRQVIPGVGHVRRLVNGNELTLLANGYPVNFVGESVPDQEIAFILALLQQGSIWLVQNRCDLQAGFVEVPTGLQTEIEERHNQMLGERQPRPSQQQSAAAPGWLRRCLNRITGKS